VQLHQGSEDAQARGAGEPPGQMGDHRGAGVAHHRPALWERVMVRQPEVRTEMTCTLANSSASGNLTSVIGSSWSGGEASQLHLSQPIRWPPLPIPRSSVNFHHEPGRYQFCSHNMFPCLRLRLGCGNKIMLVGYLISVEQPCGFGFRGGGPSG